MVHPSLELAHTSDVKRQSLTNPVAMADLTRSPLPWIRNLGMRPHEFDLLLKRLWGPKSEKVAAGQMALFDGSSPRHAVESDCGS
jgi:hypothetical protein